MEPTAKKKQQRPIPSDAPPSWRGPARTVATVLLLGHLTAVFVGPWASPPPSSRLAQGTAAVLEPYLQATFLYGHGYRFFAPNPGPSHLVRYQLEMHDGGTQSGVFPDLNAHWPRLLYHRNLMLSETIYNLSRVPPDPPERGFGSPEDRQAYQRAKGLYDALLHSVARDLLRQSSAARLTIEVQEHIIPSPEEVRRGMKLDDPVLYRTQRLGGFVGDEP